MAVGSLHLLPYRDGKKCQHMFFFYRFLLPPPITRFPCHVKPTYSKCTCLSPQLTCYSGVIHTGERYLQVQDPEVASEKLEDCSQTLGLNVIIKG